MYTSFYNLSEMPFTISTDPRFLWLGEKHQEALANLKYGLLEANGYVVLTGDVGTGKTTLVNALIESLDDNILVANINHPTLSIIEFFKFMAQTYGAPSDFTSKSDFLITFTQFLEKSHTEGKTVLLIIDEAHRLSESLLEEIRLLSNIEQHGIKLINIFFVGQNELKEILLSPQFRALRQRITLFYDIAPLSLDETREYIAHRLQNAGGNRELFTTGAIRRIHSFTHGYPRLINILCGRAMLTGYVRDQQSIDESMLIECIQEISFLDPVQTSAQSDYQKTQPAQNNLEADNSQSHVEEERDNPVAAGTSETNVEQNKEAASFLEKTVESPEKKNRLLLLAIGLATLIAIIVFVKVVDNSPKSTEKFELTAPIKEQSIKQQATIPITQKSPVTRDLPANEITVSDKKFTAEPDETEKTSTRKSIAEQDTNNQPLNREETPQQQKSEKTISAQATDNNEKGDQNSNEKVANDTTREADLNGATESAQPHATASLKQDSSIAVTPPKTISVEKTKQVSRKQPSKTKITILPSLPQPTTLELAVAALNKGDYQKSIDILKTDNNLATDGPDEYRQTYAKALVGLAEQQVSRFPLRAESLFRQAVEQDPQNSEAHFALGKIYTQLKEYALAIDAYNKAASLNPTFTDALFNLGFLYATTGLYEDAEQMFTRVVQLKPEYQDKALFNLAIIQERLGKREASLVNLQKAVILKPDNEKLQNYLKETLKNKGRIQQ